MLGGLSEDRFELSEDAGVNDAGLSSESDTIREDLKINSTSNMYSTSKMDDYIEVLDSGKSITDFYNFKKLGAHGRISDYVVIPQMSFTGFDTRGNAHLTFDALQLVKMAETTIKMLGQQGKKVLRKPCLLTEPEPFNDSSRNAADFLSDIFAKLSIATSSRTIMSERQYTINFNVVGHGSPTGVGMPDPRDQLSALALATLFHKAFKSSDIDEHLQAKAFSVEFHCCNTAYVKASSSITPDELKIKVLNESYIGQFYQHMKKLGYSNIQVAGYRGFYATRGGSSAIGTSVQDSYNRPSHVISASKARYVLSNNECILPMKDVRSMVFDVQLDVNTSLLKACKL